MQSFTYYSPTKVLFGRDTQKQVGQEIRDFGGTRVLVVYGGGSVIKSGLLAEVEESLRQAGLACRLFGGVQPNPRLSLAREGIRQALDFQADFLLAVGGGSVLDTAKGIAHGAAVPEVDIWEYWSGRKKVEKSLPVASVLTISAAGSETSDSAVLTNEETGEKRGLSTAFNRPRFAIMNPELTYTLPSYQIACGIVDIMMHTMDRYFTHTKGNQLTDEIAEGLLRTVIANGGKAMENSRDYQAMSELMWCGSLSHNSLTGLGAVTDFAPHKLGHELSARFDVAHGASLSTVWGSWAEYAVGEEPSRFVRFGEKVWGLQPTGQDLSDAKAAIETTVAYFRSLDMPTSFTQLGIGVQEEKVLEEMADLCTNRGSITVANFKKLGREDILAIYRMANR